MSYVYKGKVVSGTKEGAYWVSKYSDRIAQKIGVKPFPGTLNIQLKEPAMYPEKSIFIPSWREGAKYYGAVFIFPATMLNTRVWVVLPEKNRNPPNIIEVISQYRLRTRFDLKDGDPLSIEIED